MSNSASSGPSAATVSLVTATAIVVADMVGVGVFTSLGFQVKDITSGFSLMLLWIVGGIVAMCGAISYAELASMFPRSSGEYNFLRRIYHPALGFLAGWLSGTVGFAAPIALAAMAFGVYFKSIVPSIPPLLSGLIVVCFVSLIHLRGLRHISIFQNLWTALKLAMIVVFICAGFAFGTPQPISFVPSAVDFTHVVSAPFFISLVFVMYSYSGWNAATYIIGELRDPNHVLPRALFFGTLIVITLYVALNAVFLYTTPISALSGQLDVAMVAGTSIFGAFGGRIVAGLICLGLISSISAMVWIGPRVTMTMGEDLPLLRFFAQKSKQGVPARAILLQLLVATVLMLSQSFEAVLDFIQFSLTLSSFLTVLGVIVLRISKPEIPRPYRAWGYPVTPLIFLTVMLFMMYYLITNRPLQSVAGLGIMLAGLAIYGMSRLISNAPTPEFIPHFLKTATPAMLKFKLVAAFACVLVLSSLPARGADVATPDDTARFLAGMQPSAESPLAALAKDPSWSAHARYMDGIFDQTEKRHLSKIREFAKARLTTTHDTMFYMFAGPDALHAVSFFPNATTYVMAGLEPVGNIPPLNTLSRGTLFGSLQNLAYSMNTLLTLSFFRTKDMKSQLRAGPIFGTIPIISVFLVRAGKTIHDISYVKIDNDGVEHPANEAGVTSNAPAVKVVFSDGKDGRKQTLYYFSTDLSDSGLKVSGFLAFCDKLGRGDSFVKSASYLMHGGNFKTIRSFLLARSDLILQDDSGIPLGYFNRKAWQFQPLGRYLGPIEIFPGTYQPQMADLFRTGNAIPLDFGIGYRWRNDESNMLLATRTTEPLIAPEVSQLEAPPPRVQRAPARPPEAERPQLRRFWPFQ